ncbi:MAG: protein kinase domain-containing protein [Planctomycetota bacterium]
MTTERPEPDKLERTVDLSATVSAAFFAPLESAPIVPQIGPYLIEGELGRGGMGVVYVAEDQRLRRRVALKVLSETIAKNQEALRRFEREAQLLAALNHANIATIFSLEDSGGLRYFTMELVPGETLGQQLKKGPLSIDTTLNYCRQVAGALQAAHRQQVIHRDLKPANIMVTPDGQVKILDFGIATALGAVREQLGLEPHAFEIVGTAGYMSPEQVRGAAIDERTDIWAFGCLAFECVTGRQVFIGSSLQEVFDRTITTEVDWTPIPKDVPPQLRDLMERCLRKVRDERLGSIADARRVIEDLLARRSIAGLDVPDGTAPDSSRHNLPRFLTSFVGREVKRAELRELVQRTPLLTLTGTGGSGKSRLAIEVGRESVSTFADGVWLVELAALADASLLGRAVASVLSIQEESQRPVIETLWRNLEHKRMLLILDNCEHVLSASAELVSELLRRCANLRIIATSREGLGVPGEHLHQIASLQLPIERKQPNLEELAANEAVLLFLDRARVVKPTFALTLDNALSIAQVCRRLDGIPLALELAAARIRVLPVEEIAKRLADRFRLLTGGSKTALPRQQTLRATIDWSYDQLGVQEQLLLRRLAIFAGGFSLEAVERVCAAHGIEEWEILDLLTKLVDKSLVEVGATADSDGDAARYRLLETLRQYALDRLLEKGETDEARARHEQYFLQLAEDAQPRLAESEQAQWFNLLDREHDNLRAALQSTMAGIETVTVQHGLRLAAALGRFWMVRGHWTEARSLFDELLTYDAAQVRSEPRASALGWASALAAVQGDLLHARAFADESLSIRQELGDERGIATAFNDSGIVAKRQGDVAAARSYFEGSLSRWRALKMPRGVAAALNNLALLAAEVRDFDAARTYYAECISLLRELGDHHGIAVALNGQGSVAYEQGDYDAAAGLYEEALVLSREIGNRRTERNILGNLGFVAYARGDLATARTLTEQGLVLKRELGDTVGVAATLESLGRIVLDAGDLAAAMRIAREGLGLAFELTDGVRCAGFFELFAKLALSSRAARRAARLAGAARAHAEASANEKRGSTTRARDLDSWLDAARPEISTAEFDLEFEAGRALSLKEAVALCLETSSMGMNAPVGDVGS